jgi:hypothetical protein
MDLKFGNHCRWIHNINDKAMKLGQNNSKATNALLNGLGESVFTKVAHCKSTKDIWDKL